MECKKKRIRRLIHNIPDLVKAHMVNQAFETERIIASTFSFSDEFKELMRNIPQNYIEDIFSLYSDSLYKAFKGGVRNAEIKSTSVKMPEDPENLDHEIDVRMPMSYTLRKDLTLAFRQAAAKHLETVTDSAIIYVQFGKDLEKAYKDGVKEFLNSLKEESDTVEEKVEDVKGKEKEILKEGGMDAAEALEEELEEKVGEEIEEELGGSEDVNVEVEVEMEQDEEEDDEEDEEDDEEDEEDEEEDEEEKQEKAEAVFELYASRDLKNLHKTQASAGMTDENMELVGEFNDWLRLGGKATNYIPGELKNAWRKQLTAQDNEDRKEHRGKTGNKLEDYTKLLGDPQAEKVLRYALGLPPLKAEAAAKSEDKKKKRSKKDIAKLEEYTRLINDPIAQKVLRYELGLPVKASLKVEGKEKPTKKKKYGTKELEEYTRLVSDPAAQKVLRYELGLPVKASAEKRALGGRVIGPYDTQALKEKIKSLVASHDMDEGDLQIMVVECVVSGMNGMDDAEAAAAVSNKLGLQAGDEPSMSDVEEKADMLASNLNISMGLPGDLVFVNVDGDFCLAYSFSRNDAEKMARNSKEEEKRETDIVEDMREEGRAVASISSTDRREIEKLASLNEVRTVRDVSKASRKIGAYIDSVLASMGKGRIGIAEGCRKLKANLEDVVGDVYGHGGLEYYQELKRNK